MDETKTDILPVIPTAALAIVSGLHVRVGTQEICAAEHISNLGHTLDKHLDINIQMSRTISTCSLHLCNIRLIQRYLIQPTVARVVNAVVTSRLDYCQAPLVGPAHNSIARRLRLQNAAARLITRQARSESATAPSALAICLYNHALLSRPFVYVHAADCACLHANQTSSVSWVKYSSCPEKTHQNRRLCSRSRSVTRKASFTSMLKTQLFTQTFTQIG